VEAADDDGSTKPASKPTNDTPPTGRSKEKGSKSRENTYNKGDECSTCDTTPEKYECQSLKHIHRRTMLYECRHFDTPSLQSAQDTL
jgi:hypothetical protein